MKKRMISLLLVLVLVASLCGTSAWAEGDTVYVTKDKELLIRKTESGAGLPNNSWPVCGRSLDRVTEYSYDEFGNLTEERTSLVNPSMADFLWNLENAGDGKAVPTGTESIVLDTRSTVNGYGIMKQYDFEDGLLTHERTFVKDYDDTIDEANYTYYENGQLKSSESFSYLDGMFFWEYDVPGQRLYEFDENGCCTHWYNVEEDGMGETDAVYTYDADGKLTSLSLRVNGGEPQTMTPVYENGVQVATIHVAPDGGEVEQRFSYDDQGRVILIEYDAAEAHKPEYLFSVDGYANEIRYNEYKAGDRHITVAITYNDDGLVNDAEWRSNGNFVAWTQYQYPVDEDGDIGYSYTDNGYGPSLWGGSTSSTYWRNDKVYTTRAGNPKSEKNYSLEILGSNLRYVKTETSYEYETRGISVPVESAPAAQTLQGELAAEMFYPVLRESYAGTPVPTPNGSKRLVRVVMEQNATELPVIAELAYAADGTLAGVVTSFDSTGIYDDWQHDAEVKTDDQGRLIYDADQNRWGNTVHTYTYAEDGQSYTLTAIRADKSSDRDFSLADMQIQDLVNKDLARGKTREYNDEGLLIRVGKYFTKDSEGNVVEAIEEYPAYRWETGVTTWNAIGTERLENATVFKKEVITPYGSSSEHNFLIFDSDGYLVSYIPLSAFDTTFDYFYE